MELFTPDNATTVMKLCDVTVQHVGNQLLNVESLAVTVDDFPVTLEAKEADDYDVSVAGYKCMCTPD